MASLLCVIGTGSRSSPVPCHTSEVFSIRLRSSLGRTPVLLEVESYIDVTFDWEKGTNRALDTWMFSELVVLVRDSE